MTEQTTNAISPATRDLATVTEEQRLIALYREQKITLKNTVARGLKDEEFEMFIRYAAKYNLDPFAKQIWAVKFEGENGPVSIYAGRDGARAWGNRQPEFSGFQSAVVYDSDEFSWSAENGEFRWNHTSNYKPGRKIIGAWAAVWRKDQFAPNGRSCYFVFCPIDQHYRDTKAWKQHLSDMMIKCAETRAFEKQFPLDGLLFGDQRDFDLDGPQPRAVVEDFDAFADKPAPKPKAQEETVQEGQFRVTEGEGAEDTPNATEAAQAQPQAQETPDPRMAARELLSARGWLRSEYEDALDSFKTAAREMELDWRIELVRLAEANPSVELSQLTSVLQSDAVEPQGEE